MRASRTAPIAALAALALALAASPARADDPASVLTTGAAGTDGANVVVGDVLNASVAAGTTANFATAAGGSTGVKCAVSAFTATVTDNPVAPGVAGESTTGHTFSSCTANIFGVTKVNSVTVNNLPFGTTVDSATGAVTVTGTDTAPIQTTLSGSTYKMLDSTRPVVGAQAVGIARAAYEFLLERIQSQTLHGTPMASHQHIMFELAEMHMEITASRMLAHRAAWMADHHLDNVSVASMAKAHAARTAQMVTTRAMVLLGDEALEPGHPVEKWYRDAKIYDIFEGTGQIQRRIIAKTMTGMNPT